jgi:hypothetical protein
VNNSLEAVSSKIAGAHSCFQTKGRYRKLVREVLGRMESQREFSVRSLERNIFHQPSDTPEIMGSFLEEGWEISRKG